MKLLILAFSLYFGSSVCRHGIAKSIREEKPLVLAHYLAWYQAKPVSSVWNWHWTMDHFNPEKILLDGRREIASHNYPLIGPYDSSDPDVLEYHASLMKLSGIDGAIFDWYGTSDFSDYGLIHRDVALFIRTLKRYHLKFAICYEPQSVKFLAEAGKIDPSRKEERVEEDLKWLSENWLRDPLYAKWGDRSALLVFGEPLIDSDQWAKALSSLPVKPALFLEDNLLPAATGVFGWPPMGLSKDGTLSKDRLNGYLDALYGKKTPTIAVVMPGFHDFYQEAGLHPSYGFMDTDDGDIFSTTLKRGIDSKSLILQIATWNDFGEGTVIEPTRESGFRFLEILRRTIYPKKPEKNGEKLLRLPLRVYRLRKENLSANQRKSLDEVENKIAAGQFGEAEKRIDELERRAKSAKKSSPSNP